MVIRSVADGDRDAIFALGVAEEVAWFGQAEISAEEIGEWIEDEGGVASGAVAVDDAGNVCGFARAGPASGGVVGRSHPDDSAD